MRTLVTVLRLGAPLVAVLLLGAPRVAAAETFQPSLPSIGDALRRVDRIPHAPDEPPPRAGDLEQTFVLPERPGQNAVSWYGFEWHHLDVASPSGGKGGVRLYYYAREQDVAEHALPVIRNAYLRLVDQFHYTPTRRIPYILYASQREFQTTNVFQVTESVLGVTSPEDLKMSLPYFGDHELFREVCTHEMVHQFTIQKLLDLAGDDQSSAIDLLPLWFVEGIAEYYAKGGLDAETDVYLRDLVWNPDPERRYEVVSFQEDRLRGYIPTYKLGQARVAFVAEVYGKEKIQAFLESASQMVSGGGGSPSGPPGERGFAALTRRVLNEALEQVDARWRVWLKRRYYPAYEGVAQDLGHVGEVRKLPAEAERFAVSPDGTLLFFRGLDRDDARARLYLVDPRDPGGAEEVASDNQPGFESLHPIEHSVLAIGASTLAYAAQSGAGDALYVQPYRHEQARGGKSPVLELGDRRRLDVLHPAGRKFVEIFDPSFSPDGTQIAFVGVTDLGRQDVYLLPTGGGTARQLTDDAYAKRHLAWGGDGLYLASDATDHGRFNLFRIDVASGERTRLTTGNWNDGHPRPLSDGSVLYSSEASGKPDLYLLRDGASRRLTNFATALTGPVPAPEGRGVWAQTFYRGRFRVVEVPRAAWLDAPPVKVSPPGGPVLPIPAEPIPSTTPPYRPGDLGNWRPETGIVYGGGGAGTVAGRAAVIFADTLRDHLLYLDLAVYGSFELTQALALYEDRSERRTWALGVYHFVNQQLDTGDPNLEFLQRDFGLVGTLRFPVDRFRRFEVELSAGAVSRYCLTDYNADQPVFCGGPQVQRSSAVGWDQRNGGVNPQLGPTLRYGYDTVRYDPYAGSPIEGDALLLEVGGNYLPWLRAVNGFARTDVTRFIRLLGRMRLSLRLAAGSSFAPNDVGKNWERTWWLTSADNLRGYSPLDLAYLVGQAYYVANLEVQFPLDPLLRFVLFEHITGVGGVDFGGVFDRLKSAPGADVHDLTRPPSQFGAWETRTLTGVLGANVLFGPLLFRIHFGHPFDIGGIKTPAMRSGTSWVTNISLRYFFF